MALEIGVQRPLLVREERVSLQVSSRLLYASDIHLHPRNEPHIIYELKRTILVYQPDIFLLGGDLVDHPRSLTTLRALLNLAHSRGVRVGAVGGNHDTLVGRKRVQSCVEAGGGVWLEESPMEVGRLRVLGSLRQASSHQPQILCSHYPTAFPRARECGVGLVLAGHLHGWQVVFARWGEYLLPGAILSRWNGLRFQRGSSTLLMSRGMTDLLPLRWNCPREVLLVDLEGPGALSTCPQS